MTSDVITVFGQLIVGPPGSGKTTYCYGMSKYLKDLGRNVKVVNLDPANDPVSMPFKPDLDIANLVTVEDVMDSLKLGPNGGLMYCMEYLDANFDWFYGELVKLVANDSKTYLLFDCPGQVELYVHHQSLKNILTKLQKAIRSLPSEVSSDDIESVATSDNPSTSPGQTRLDLRLVAVNLVDSHYANEPAKYISMVLNSLSTMLHLGLPHINVLSKVDLLKKSAASSSRDASVHFGVDFYCEVLDLSYLVNQIADDPFLAKHKKLTRSLADIISDYSLVSYIPLDINDARFVLRVLHAIDQANGFYLSDLQTAEHLQKLYDRPDFDYAKYGQLREEQQ